MKIVKTFLLTITPLFACSIFLKAQQSLSLEQAIRIALQNNYGIRIEQREADKSELENTWGNAGRLPQLNLVSNMDANTGNSDLNPKLTAGLEFEWLIYGGNRVRLSKAKLTELEELSEGRLKTQMELTLKEVILSYYLARLEYQKLAVASIVLEQSEARLAQEEAKTTAGLEGSYALLQAQQAYNEDLQNQSLQDLSYKQSLLRLNQLIALPPTDSFRLSDSIPINLHSYDYENLKATALQNNSELQNQLHAIQTAELDVKLARTSYLPTLSFQSGLQAGYPATDALAAQTKANGAFVGLSLKQSLYAAGARSRTSQLAHLQKQQEEIRMQEGENALYSQLWDSYARFTTMQKLYVLAGENLQTARVNLDLSKERYAKGLLNSIEFRDVQLSYRNTAMARIEIAYQLACANIQLQHLSGSILKQNTNN